MVITKLEPNEFFVFGSNLAGRHGAGAALQAAQEFGAQYGVGEGLTGQCWAFPTLDAHLRRRPLVELEAARDALYAACLHCPSSRFLLTKVGCGIAGYPEPLMRGLFSNPPKNLILPEDWK